MTANTELKNRWTDELIDSVLRQLRSSQSPDPFGRTENGLWDLRGFTIREGLRTISMKDIDLSYCKTEGGGQLLSCELSNVTLSHAMLETNLNGTFTACKFDGANLSRVRFRGRFIDCTFLKTKLKDAAAEAVSFVTCCFDGADLRGAHLCSCTFESCTWKDAAFGNGSFHRSKFTGNHPCDLGNTIIDRAEFV
jgi:uncharacterized protein YjbI with pentapeptide repeats